MGSAQWGRRDNNEGLITIDLSDHTDTGDIISVQHVASRPHGRTPALTSQGEENSVMQI